VVDQQFLKRWPRQYHSASILTSRINMNKSFFRAVVIASLVFYISGCATFEQGISSLPIALSLIRSPISIKTELGKNGPILLLDKCILNELNEIYASEKQIDEDEYLKKLNIVNQTCLAQSNEKEADFNYDNLKNLYFKDSNTIVFAAISGGGARAAALAEATFTLLERKYNSLKKRTEITRNYSSLLENIDAFSTVSGGSLFSYQAARANRLLELKQESYHALNNTSLDKNKNILNIKDSFYILERCAEYGFDSIKKYDENHGAFDKELKNYETSRETNISNELKLIIDEQIMRAKEGVFECISSSPLKLSKQGAYSAAFHMSPFNLFIGPLVTSFTNETYLSVLAGTLHGSTTFDFKDLGSSHESVDIIRRIYDPSYFKLSDLPETPRFYFNATSLETGLPFVFTQRFVQLPLKNHIPIDASRLDEFLYMDFSKENDTEISRLQRPFGRMTTLEDLNSSPADTPLAYAAIASAAFPLGFEPLSITKYGYDPVARKVYESDEPLHLSDGGLYDNSGLSTISELLETIMAVRENVEKPAKYQKPPINVILLSINADADEYDAFYANKTPGKAGFSDISPIDFNIPVRYRSLGFDSLSLIHYVNKRRAEQLAVKKIQNIVCGKDSIENCKINPKVNFLYFPVNLAQLSPQDKHHIPDPSNLFNKLKQIPTNFVISDEDEVVINQSAELIVSSEQKNLNASNNEEISEWENALRKIKACEILQDKIKPNLFRLDESFAFSVLCAASTTSKQQSELGPQMY